jgi:mannan endo-1,4-beta-mannosidase
MRRAAPLVILLALGACDTSLGGGHERDAGTVQALDAGLRDASALDVSMNDAAAIDAPVSDARSDAFTAPDAWTMPAHGFVTASGDELMRDGARYRFVGVNLRGLPHFGTSILPYAPTSEIETELAEAARMGARVVRVFAAANDADAATVAARLGNVLDRADAHDLTVIVTLTDFYPTGLFPQGDEGAYADAGGYTILTTDWFRSGYRAHYQPWVNEIVSRYASHPAVMAWELGNEIKCDGDHAAFFSFVDTTTAAIRAHDTNHLITIGMITARWLSDAEAHDLYARPAIGLLTLHDYEAAHTFTDFELAQAHTVNKPLIVEEAGFSMGDRAAATDADLRYEVDARGMRGYLQWGFVAVTHDDGNGDRTFGLDRVFHAGDYDAIFSVYQAAATRIR